MNVDLMLAMRRQRRHRKSGIRHNNPSSLVRLDPTARNGSLERERQRSSGVSRSIRAAGSHKQKLDIERKA